MTPSEQLVFDLCKRSFLTLWSYANPLRTDGRELCDVLAVFEDHVVVFSIKEITFNDSVDPEVAAERWVRKAVDASIEQLSGARRQLEKMTSVVRSDSTPGLELPKLERRRTHYIAVAAGGKRQVVFSGGEKKEGLYVHVMDEFALREILRELDTAADFSNYLEAKEGFRGTIVCEGEENLLGLYLHNKREFPKQHLIVVEDGIWNKLQQKPEFRARKEQDKISYWWDARIESLADHSYDLGPPTSPSDRELLVRTMAAENRFARRFLSRACLDWLARKEIGSRMFRSDSGIGYVFATYARKTAREQRVHDLTARCFVARSPQILNSETVIGLATEQYDASGYSFDAVYLTVPTWTADDQAKALEARTIFRILESPRYAEVSVEEFPIPTSRDEAGTVARNRAKRDRRKRR